MKQLSGSIRRFRFVLLVGLLGASAITVHAGIWIQPVTEDSPMIKKGHLEGGVNGEGAPRPGGETPMMRAIQAHQLDVIDYLLTHGVNLSLKDAAGETAMDIARWYAPDIAAKLAAYLAKHPNPSEYYGDTTPVLAIVSGSDQTGSPDSGGPESMVVSVTDTNGRPLVDAPVNFTVDGGGQNLLTAITSPDSPSLLMRTGSNGYARANVHLPKNPGDRITITASAGIPGHISKVKFSAGAADDGSGGGSCFDPADVSATQNPDGSIDVTWVNRTQEDSCIKVWVRTPGAWKLGITVPAHSTSAHIPPP
jgi:hypothetical protein